MTASYPVSPSGAVPAGWYPDVEQPGRERWWNGALWTDHRRPAVDPTLTGQEPAAFGLTGAPADRPAVPAGWYPDPMGGPQPRWWDGHAWSTATPGPMPMYGSTTVVNVVAPKSVGVAFLLTFLFGPFGMLYSTVPGALIMLGVSVVGGIVFGILTLGLIWFVWGPLMWVISIVWGCIAASPGGANTTVIHR